MTSENVTQMERQLRERIAQIRPADEDAAAAARRHSDRLTKPPGSLGKLEELAARLAGMTGKLWPDVSRRAVLVMAADHGVCEEGVSAFPPEVTPQMVLNFLEGGAAVNVLARQAGADVFCVDVGVNADLSHPRLIERKVRRGTANMAAGPAMEREEALRAVLAGMELVAGLSEEGYGIFVTGEMGIGNTTASAAIVSVLTGMPPERAAGSGTGIDEERRKHKAAVIGRAIERNNPDASDPIDVLAKVGGLEIAALTGAILGAASCRRPVVVDGYISSAAALAAVRLAPAAADYMIASHLSREQGHGPLLEAIGLSPMAHLDMRLGEGTGAVLSLHLVDASLRLMQEMATFESAGVSRG